MRRFASAMAVLAVGVSGVTILAQPASPSTTSTTNPARAPIDRPAPVCVHVAVPPTPGVTATRPEVCSSWQPRDTWSGRTPSVYVTTFRPNTAVVPVVAYAAWLRTSSTDLALYLGYKGPGVTALAHGPMMVPLTARPRLLATFNSGFYEADVAGGFYTNHTLYFPMVSGLATVVRYRDGTVDVTAWRGGARPGPDVLMARQNLPLLVSNNAPTARATTNALWGLTLHGVPAVWRTALGVTGSGDLVYAAAPAQTSASMAHVMVLLHCVRAMQLDINPEWPIFVTYAAPGAQGPSLFVPNPNQIPGRFLYASTKDFFAVFRSNTAGEAQPW
jgi:hypothetical protein